MAAKTWMSICGLFLFFLSLYRFAIMVNIPFGFNPDWEAHNDQHNLEMKSPIFPFCLLITNVDQKHFVLVVTG